MPYDQNTGEWIDPQPADDPADGQRSNAEWAALRQANRATKDAEAVVAAKDRELAFMRAGIDTTKDKKLEYFVAAYTGENTPEAINAAAVEAGFITVEVAPPTGELTPQQIQDQANLGAQARVAAASTGAAPPPLGAESTIIEAFHRGGESAMMAALADTGVGIAYEGVIVL